MFRIADISDYSCFAGFTVSLAILKPDMMRDSRADERKMSWTAEVLAV